MYVENRIKMTVAKKMTNLRIQTNKQTNNGFVFFYRVRTVYHHSSLLLLSTENKP